MRSALIVARSVLIEAIRRKEIYVIVMLAVLVILLTGSIRIFNLEGTTKFYREVSLQIMNLAVALTVIVLAARQLPREFEARTIYPLLAKPIGRSTFLAGKFLGVLFAGLFCYGVFILLFLGGMFYLEASLSWPLFAQAVYLQVLAIAVTASLAFVLSLVFNVDTAIAVSILLFGLSSAMGQAVDFIHDAVAPIGVFRIGSWVGSAGDLFMRVLLYGVPQLSLFDLTKKLVHEGTWGPVEGWVILQLTLYAAVYLSLFLGISYLLFRRRPL